jgi:uncharacterized heparinase superfamily protein
MHSQVKRLLLYWNTLRYLRPVQIFGRILYRIRRPRPDLSPPPPTRRIADPLPFPAWRAAAMRTENTFVFLNEMGDIHGAHDWNASSQTKLWIYNLHYFDDLTALDARARADWHRSLIARWITENPPASGQGWEPYPASLRIVNWIKWILTDIKTPAKMIESLAIQTRWLLQRMEYHLLGNHLIANAKALVFSGLFFEGVEATHWYRIGMNVLEHEFVEQVLADGGHFERSPMYHHIILEDIIDLVHMHRVFGVAPPSSWTDLVSRMLAWSEAMLHPDRKIAFFNDAAFSIAPTYDDLAHHAAMLDVLPPASNLDRLIHLAQSGYVRLTALNAVVLADIAAVGPGYLPAHAHADTLSFELSLQGERVVVNSGTSVYGTGEERQRQRSTAAHATLTIDGQNSSEVWGGFRVGRRAAVSNVQVAQEAEHVTAEATHNGYSRLAGSPHHSRRWKLGANELLIQDRMTGNGDHNCLFVYPLRPGLTARLNGNNVVDVMDTSRRSIATFAFDRGDVAIEPGTWHPEFGKSIPNLHIRLRLHARFPSTIETRITWQTP